MFNDIGASAAGSSWESMQSLPEASYGLILPTISVVKTPEDLLQVALGVNTAIRQESTQQKPLQGSVQRLEKRAGGALTVEEAAYTLKRMASFAHSRAAPKVAAYIETVKVDSNYPNGASSRVRNNDGSPKNWRDRQYFDYQNVNWQEWTTGKRKDETVGRVTTQDAGTVERGEGGVPISVIPSTSNQNLNPDGNTGSYRPPVTDTARFQDKIVNHFYKKGQPIYKQPYVYYSIGLGLVGFFFWYRSQE